MNRRDSRPSGKCPCEDRKVRNSGRHLMEVFHLCISSIDPCSKEERLGKLGGVFGGFRRGPGEIHGCFLRDQFKVQEKILSIQ